MKNKDNKANALIKRKNLRKFLKDNGISSISKDAIIEMENHLEKEVEDISHKLKEQLIINAKQTAKVDDVREVIKDF